MRLLAIAVLLFTLSNAYIMDGGTNWCADGFEPITSSAECKVYTDGIQGLRYEGSGNWHDVPKGCYIKSGVFVYFNTHYYGAVSKICAPICKLITSPWTVSPSHEPSTTSTFTPPPTPSTLSLPSNDSSKYSVMDGGTNRCPDGFKAITSSAVCKGYANDTPGLMYQSSGYWGGILSGCFILDGVNVYFNTRQDGSPNSYASLVCQPMTSPWSSSFSDQLSTSSAPSTSFLPSHAPSTEPSALPSISLIPSASSGPSVSSAPSATTDWWSPTPIDILRGHTDYVVSVRFSPDGKWIASAGYDRKIILWDLSNGGAAIMTIDAHTEDILSIDFSPHGTKLVSTSSDNVVKIWNVDSDGDLTLNNTLYNKTATIFTVKSSPDGKYIASGGGGETIKIWNVEDGGISQTLTGHAGLVISSLAFTPNSKTLASGSYDYRIKLWDIEDGTEIGSFMNNYTEFVESSDFTLRSHSGHTNGISSLSFTPDGKTLASGSYDGIIIIWIFESSALIFDRTIAAHDGSVDSVQFSPDGMYLASGSGDDTIKLWNRYNNYSHVTTFRGHTSFANSIDFSPNGQKIASGSRDSTIRIWGTSCGQGRYGNHDGCPPCPSGTYTDQNSCIPCPAGTFQEEEDAEECKSCSRGTYQPLDGQTHCYECAVGGFCPGDGDDGSGFILCPTGTYNDKKGASNKASCVKCSPGTYQIYEGQQHCEECPTGTYSNVIGATKEASCVQCSPGTYQPFKGQTQCKECRAGGFCPKNAEAVVTCDGGFEACPSGTYNNATGAYNVISCIPCPQGTYSDNKTGLEACFECPKGRYQNNEGETSCKICDSGTVQNKTGQPRCEKCPPDTIPDPSGITCLQCPYRLGNSGNSIGCPFCAEHFYLKNSTIKISDLNKDPTTLCLPCPGNAQCKRNTTIETIKGDPGFWRDSDQTEVFYECNKDTKVCLGGTSCAKGHTGVKCEVCRDKDQHFNKTKGKCMKCPPFLRIGIVVGIIVGVCILLFVVKYISHKYAEVERFSSRIILSLRTIGIQAKGKILISFFQIIITLTPVYGVQMHSTFSSWFSFYDIFNFALTETFGVPASCFGPLKTRLLINGLWPFALIFVLIIGTFVYTTIVDILIRTTKRKRAIANFLSRSLHGLIIIIFCVLPFVCRQIFDARTCRSYVTNDAYRTSSSYHINDWSVKCQSGDPDEESIQRVFWALFAIWIVAVPLVAFLLILFIRPSVRSNSISPLAEVCRFIWFDYNRGAMFWEVVELVRKIFLTSLILFIDTEKGADRILRLIIAVIFCIVYGTFLSRARPYKQRDDLDLAIFSNLLLTCCFLVGIIIHQCKEEKEIDGENATCMKLFGLKDSYNATLIAFILTVSMIIAFFLFVIVLANNEINAPMIRLVSTNNAPNLDMPKDCKYHLFISHVWVSGQDKVHKIVRMLNMYLQGVKIWLDVDVLESLNDPENSVAEALHFVLFYSKGFFRSKHCRRQVVKAMEADKPITVMFEPDDVSLKKYAEMKEEFSDYWPNAFNSDLVANYVFENYPISWISKGKQLSLESMKLVAGRLLKDLPYYKKNSDLLDAGVNIDGEIKSVQMLTALDILYCSTNDRAHYLALKIAEMCTGDVSPREMNLSDNSLQQGNKRAAMLVYLNRTTFQNTNVLLCESIKRSIEEDIEVFLVHENDSDKGGCDFGEIINQTPKELIEQPYSIYSKDIAVNLYSIKEFEEASLSQLLIKMGGKDTGTKDCSYPIIVTCIQMKDLFHQFLCVQTEK